MREIIKKFFSKENKEPFERIIDRLILLNVLILIIASIYISATDARLNVRNSGAFVMPIISLAALVYVREYADEGRNTAMAMVLFFGIRELILLIFYPRPF